MSEFLEKEADKETSCQKKLALPRSLRAAGERAEIVWEMIVKRYPNAAPLLCDMETVIERAESLLSRLKIVHREDDKDIGRSSSTQSSDFEETKRAQSSNSITESSSSHSEDFNSEVEEVGTRISYDRIPQMENVSSENSTSSSEEVENKESINQTSIDLSQNSDLERNKFRGNLKKNNSPGEEKNESNSEKGESLDSLISASHDKKRDCADSVKTRQVESLENWDKVVGGQIMHFKPKIDKREISNERHDRHNSDISSSRVPKLHIPNHKESPEICGEKTISPKKREIDSKITSKIPKTEIVSPKKRADGKNESFSSKNSTANSGSALREVMQKIPNKKEPKMESQGGNNHDENSYMNKTPVEILMDYAQQIGKKVDFKVSTNKSSNFGIHCFFAGYQAQAIASTEIAARNKVATNILRMLSENQIDKQDKTDLMPLSNDQMKFIVALDSEAMPENAMRKLYKLCLKMDATKPIYSVKKSDGSSGITHLATCEALGKICDGKGIREECAKISAAQKLYMELVHTEKFS